MGDNNIKNAFADIKVENKTPNKSWVILFVAALFIAAIYFGIQGENEQRRQNFNTECNLIISESECSRLLDIIDPSPDVYNFT